jgi:hypothetical protein
LVVIEETGSLLWRRNTNEANAKSAAAYALVIDCGIGGGAVEIFDECRMSKKSPKRCRSRQRAVHRAVKRSLHREVEDQYRTKGLFLGFASPFPL